MNVSGLFCDDSVQNSFLQNSSFVRYQGLLLENLIHSVISSFLYSSTHPPAIEYLFRGVGNRLMHEMDMMPSCPPCAYPSHYGMLLERMLEL